MYNVYYLQLSQTLELKNMSEDWIMGQNLVSEISQG